MKNFYHVSSLFGFILLLSISGAYSVNGQSIFEAYNKIKLVTHCNTNLEAANQNVVKEYLLYKSYNEVTDYSFRVRLCKITYEDSKRKKKSIARYGFLIEPTKNLAARFDGKIIARKYIQARQTNHELVQNLEVFQFLIGNQDWSVPGLHNIKLLFVPGESAQIAIPYDFDLIVMVNPIYFSGEEQATNFGIGLRQYKGFPSEENELISAKGHFQKIQDKMLNLYENFPYLSKGNQTYSLDQLTLMFSFLQESDKAITYFAKNSLDI